MIVIDASLAAKLVIEEVGSESARDWFVGLVDIVVGPDLLAIEVSQAIVRRVNARENLPEAGRTALSEWFGILHADGIRLLRPNVAQIAMAAEIAIQIGHPVKDCIYLALAIEHGGDLATCDARFAVKARSIHSTVTLLPDQSAS